MNRLRIVVIEDEELIREGICSIINMHSDEWDIVGTASNGQEGLELISSLHPEVVLTDIKMPFIDGLELTSIIRERDMETEIVIISGHADFSFAQKALKNNVADFILKPSSAEEIMKSLERVKVQKNKQDSTRNIVESNPKNIAFMTSMIVNIIYDRFISPDRALTTPDVFVNEILEQIRQSGFFTLDVEVTNSIILAICSELIDRMMRDRILTSRPTETQVQAELLRLQTNDPVEMLRWAITSTHQTMLESQDNSKLYIRTAVKYMHENFSKDITLKDVADEVYLNYYYFSQLFKKETGQTFTEYLTNVRMEKAKELLQGPKLKTYEVSSLLGYGSSKHFSMIFKKTYGISPSEYRESIRK
jgi:two-component system response regulator YesN